MDLQVSVRGVDELVAELRDTPDKLSLANIRALNRAILAARTAGIRLISADIGLTATTLREALTIIEATISRPIAFLSASLDRIPLYDFHAKGPMPSRGKGRGVTARLPGGAGTYPHAFLAQMASGHLGVFERNTKARLPIHELMGPSIGKVFAKYTAQMIAAADASFETTLDHELQFRQGAA